MGHCIVFNVEELSRDKDYKYHFFFGRNAGSAFIITCLLYKTTLPSYSKMILLITLHPKKAYIAFRNHQFIFGIEI